MENAKKIFQRWQSGTIRGGEWNLKQLLVGKTCGFQFRWLLINDSVGPIGDALTGDAVDQLLLEQ